MGVLEDRMPLDLFATSLLAKNLEKTLTGFDDAQVVSLIQ